MKYLFLLFTSILFSQNTKQDTLYVYANKTDWNKNESWNKKSFNEVELTLKKDNHFDSLVFTLEKSNKRLKRKVNKNNSILFKDFIKDEIIFFKLMEKFVIYIIYDKKKYYQIISSTHYGKIQE
jgi:hypothetical protein